MEENKNLPPVQNVGGQNNQNGNGGGRKRRRKKRNRGGGGNGQNENAQRAQNNQNNQNAQKQKGNNNQEQRVKQPQPQNAQKQKNNNNNHKAQQKQQNQSGQNHQAQDENRKDTYAYVLDGNLYINLTNKCSNGCDFCVRNERASYYGNYLWLRNGEPTAEKVIAQVNGLGDLKKFKEVVFCGFGEPTYRMAEMVALCDYFHEKGLPTRLNTNGQGNLINKRDIVPEIKGKIDLVNVSLNASASDKYQKICRSQYGESGFEALVEFAKICKRNDVKCRFSIVDCIGEEEVEACKRLAEQVRIPLYIRKYIADS